MGYCKTKLCEKIAKIKERYGDDIPEDIIASVGLCGKCLDCDIEELKNGSIDRN